MWRKIRKFLLYFSLSLIFITAIGLYIFFFTDFGYKTRVTLAGTILSTQHRYLVWVTFLPESETKKISDNILNPKYINSEVKNKDEIVKAIQKKNESKDIVLEKLINTDFQIDNTKKILTISIENIAKKYSESSYYTGKIVYISNPLNVKLVSSEQKNTGERIEVMAKRHNALVAINASGFSDANGMGNGAVPIGIIIQDGKIINSKSGNDSKDFVSGLTKDGVLVTGVYTPNELLKMNVQYAAGFKPQLIVNGQKMITSGDGGWGLGPRTAIGQKADGTIMFIVIDGRQMHSIGASLKEVQDLLYERGAISAMAMDGGSSSVIYYDNEIKNSTSTRSRRSRLLPNAWIVTADSNTDIEMREDGQKINVNNVVNTDTTN